MLKLVCVIRQYVKLVKLVSWITRKSCSIHGLSEDGAQFFSGFYFNVLCTRTLSFNSSLLLSDVYELSKGLNLL